MSNIKSVVIFCGSKSGTNPMFISATSELAEQLALANIKIIYGGGSVGLMGQIANTALENGGEVIGIIPELLVEWEQQHNGVTELIVTKDMHERKKLLYELADAAIVLPGGFGTLDELFEMVTWNNLKIHNKHLYIFNIDGFYNHLIQHLHTMYNNGFLYEDWGKRIVVIDNVITLIDKLTTAH